MLGRVSSRYHLLRVYTATDYNSLAYIFFRFPLSAAHSIFAVYAYIPITDSLCSQTGVICNSDYGTSLGRGSFTFQRGAWNDIALHVRLNNPADKANGVVEYVL